MTDQKTLSKRRPTIGDDPLDALIPAVLAEPRRELAVVKEELPQTPTPATEPPPRSRKVRATFHVPHDLLEEARAAVVHLAGPPVRLTLAELAETALRRELRRLRKEHNNGQDFPRSELKLRGGRPIGS